ncbi:MAG: copper-binding protein [Acidobacteriota bacterium]
MSGSQRTRLAAWLGAALSVLLLVSVAHAQPKGKSFPFRGKVEKIDAKTKTLTVNGENVQGWMSAMTMTYTADKDDVVTTVKVGDEITAKVYEGDFKTLYEVQVVPPKSKAPPAKK